MPHSRCLRSRRRRDLPQLVRLLRELHERDGFPARWPDDPQAWLRPLGLLAAWVADDPDTGDVVGHCALVRVDPDRPTAVAWARAAAVPAMDLSCVTKLFVAYDHREEGIGIALLNAAASRARSVGQRAVLEVSSNDQQALALYRRAGWKEAGTGPQRRWLPEGASSLLLVAPADPPEPCTP